MKFLIVAIVLAGCAMPNEEIIKSTKLCEDAGMDTRVLTNPYTLSVMDVICIPAGTDGGK
jgi:hypothetical protein